LSRPALLMLLSIVPASHSIVPPGSNGNNLSDDPNYLDRERALKSSSSASRWPGGLPSSLTSSALNSNTPCPAMEKQRAGTARATADEDGQYCFAVATQGGHRPTTQDLCLTSHSAS
jgi:hypothetical protein